jgi:hypothetical protein
MTRDELQAGKSHVPGEMRIGDMCGNPSQGVVGETALMVDGFCVAVVMPVVGRHGEVDLAPKLTRVHAERMVRVWNNHDALVTILEKIVRSDEAAIEELKQFDVEPSALELELYREAQAVLRRATQP